MRYPDGSAIGAAPTADVRIVIEPGQVWMRESWWSGVEVAEVREVDPARMRVSMAFPLTGTRRIFGVSELLERWRLWQDADSIAP